LSRSTNLNEYVIRVNVRKSSDVRRFCEVRVHNGTDVYVYQPKKGTPVKASYHKSGQKHVKLGNSAPIMPPMQLDPIDQIVTEENPWSKSFENFEKLMPYKNERADDTFDIDLAALDFEDALSLVEIAIGRSFDPSSWNDDGVEKVTIKQKIFPVPQSSTGLQVCVRVARLHHA